MAGKVKTEAYVDCGVKRVGTKFAALMVSVNSEIPAGNFAYQGQARDTYELAEADMLEMMKTVQDGLPIERVEYRGGIN